MAQQAITAFGAPPLVATWTIGAEAAQPRCRSGRDTSSSSVARKQAAVRVPAALGWGVRAIQSSRSIFAAQTRRRQHAAHRGPSPPSALYRSGSDDGTRASGSVLNMQLPVVPPSSGVPLWVMLPLDTVTILNKLNHVKALNAGMRALRKAGVNGVMVDVWWGVVEAGGPERYDWSAYEELVKLVASCGLKLQAVLSFHSCGCNVGDSCTVTLPPWVLDVAEKNPDVLYTDRSGRRNFEYLSLGVDNVPLFQGRTPVQIYSDFMASFKSHFSSWFSSTISSISVSLGPAGELRYPAYPEDCWRFPGIGEFQCYDKYMLANLRACALAAGVPEWGYGGPHDAGGYLSSPHDTGFFNDETGSWKSPYGNFFLSWYSQQLIAHGDRILGEAKMIFGTVPGLKLMAKLPGIHWLYKTRAHAAELTAGFYNCEGSDGYTPVMNMLRTNGAGVNFTCAEMADDEMRSNHGVCSPQALLLAVRRAAAAAGIPFAAENALPRFDKRAHDTIIANAYSENHPSLPAFADFTYLRMGELLFRPDKWASFTQFAARMCSGGTEAGAPALLAGLPAAVRQCAEQDGRLLFDVLEPSDCHRARLLGAEV